MDSKQKLQQACEKVHMLNVQVKDLQAERDKLIGEQIVKLAPGKFQEAYRQYELDNKEVEEFINDPAWRNVGRGEI